MPGRSGRIERAPRMVFDGTAPVFGVSAFDDLAGRTTLLTFESGADRFSFGEVVVTHRQNLVLPHVGVGVGEQAGLEAGRRVVQLAAPPVEDALVVGAHGALVRVALPALRGLLAEDRATRLGGRRLQRAHRAGRKFPALPLWVFSANPNRTLRPI